MNTPARVCPDRVLVALKSDWRETLQQILEQAGFLVLLADSKQEAELIIQAQPIDAVVMISDWALESDKGKSDGLMEFTRGKIPAVSLISPTTWQNARERWFDYLYLPPLHEYCSLPADADELIRRLNKALEALTSPGSGQNE